VAERDAGQQALVFADGTAQRYRDLLAVARVERARPPAVALAEVGPGVVEVERAVLLEVQHHPLGRGVEEREPRDLQLAQRVAERATAVGFLDAAGERAA